MAGIGFVLQKIIKRDSLADVFRVIAAGAMIVAGPWLLSVGAMIVADRIVLSALREGAALFNLAVVYSYTIGLVAFGGVHYLFSRKVADLAYERKKGQAATVLLYFLFASSLASIGIAAAILGFIDRSGLREPLAFDAGFCLLFVAVSATWLLLMFASLLKRYALMLAVYGLGMGAAVGLTILFGGLWGQGGALLGFASGQALIALGLAAMAFGKYKPKPYPVKEALRSFREYSGILLGGGLFTIAYWSDKIAFWFGFGEPVSGALPLNPGYDQAVFMANLSVIPGLVRFVVQTETEFFRALRRLLRAIESGTLREIGLARGRLIAGMRRELAEQCALQGVASLALALLAGEWRATVALAGAWAYLLTLTLVIFLFYLQAFFEVLLSALVFLAANLGLSALTIALGWEWAQGLGFAAAALAASLAAWISLGAVLSRYERTVFMRSSLGRPRLIPRPLSRGPRRRVSMKSVGGDAEGLEERDDDVEDFEEVAE
jgi:uncharacterized membrane protein